MSEIRDSIAGYLGDLVTRFEWVKDDSNMEWFKTEAFGHNEVHRNGVHQLLRSCQLLKLPQDLYHRIQRLCNDYLGDPTHLFDLSYEGPKGKALPSPMAGVYSCQLSHVHCVDKLRAHIVYPRNRSLILCLERLCSLLSFAAPEALAPVAHFLAAHGGRTWSHEHDNVRWMWW